MPEYKLMYFEGRGRAEIARLLFAAAGQKYDDKRYNKDTWPAAKGTTPSGQLPCLVVDGKMYSQSIPIAVYLASTFGFHGKTPDECLQINMVLGIAGDLAGCITPALFEKDEKKKTELFKKLKDEDIPKHLQIFEKLLTEAKSDYFCLKKLTLADMMVFNVLEMPVKDNPSFLDKFPKVKANMDKVKSNGGIKAWLEKRPKSEF